MRTIEMVDLLARLRAREGALMNGQPQRFPRIQCCIPFCSRGSTRFPPGFVVICGKCWRSSPARLRRRHAAIKRLLKKAGQWDFDQNAPTTQRGWRLETTSWERIIAAITTQGAP